MTDPRLDPWDVTLFDTHSWLWAVSAPENLSETAQRAWDRAAERAISAMSCWEVAVKAASGKLGLKAPIRPWMMEAINQPRFKVLPLSPEIAIRSAELRDPADCVIAASALVYGIPLVTKDARMQRLPGLNWIW